MRKRFRKKSPGSRRFDGGRIRRASWLAVALLFALSSASHGGAFKPKVVVAAFGLYGDQGVFESEANGAARIVADRFGGSPVIVRANTKRRDDANLATVAAALQSAAEAMDVENDILVLILTSHGAQGGLEVKAGTRQETLSPLSLVTALNETHVRHRSSLAVIGRGIRFRIFVSANPLASTIFLSGLLSKGSVGVSTPWSMIDLSPWFFRTLQSSESSRFSHSLPLVAVRYLSHTSLAVGSGHKLTKPSFDSKEESVCKLLSIKRTLVTGGGIEPPTLGL